MAAEEKPFDATPSRVARARREGQVPRAPELGMLASFAGGVLGVAFVAPLLGAELQRTLERVAAGDGLPVTGIASLVMLGAVPLLCAAACGVTANLIQTGGIVPTKITAKAERLKPVENLKRILSREAIVSALRALLAFTVATLLTIPAVVEFFHRGTGPMAFGGLAWLAATGAARVVAGVIAVGAAFSVADVLLARMRWRKQLRMSWYELKREMQETEGNPHVRRRRRQKHRALSSGGIAKISEAAFVVANPTHVAVALAYAPPVTPVPRVLVAATEEVALRVRELAAAQNIPIIENVALARQLYATARVGDTIPRDAFVAVAEIVSALARARARHAAGGVR